VERLNKELNAPFADPRTKARIAELGATPLPGSPADFGRFIAEEVEKWGKVVEFSGLEHRCAQSRHVAAKILR
jgi:tripartite-type tricarboxylate transporter receptor subunit TctC